MNLFDSLFTETVETTITVTNLLIALGTALLLGLLVSFVYIKTHVSRQPATGFALTMVMLPAVIAVIILLVGSNVARAFSLAGAFSIIRFRSAPGDPKDIAYVLFTLAIGLAAGMGYVAYAAIVAIALCGAMVLLSLFKFGQHTSSGDKLLKISVPESLNYTEAFTDVMSQYTTGCSLVSVKSTDLGSLFQLTYRLSLKESVNEKEFIDALRCRNGNLNIKLGLAADRNYGQEYM